MDVEYCMIGINNRGEVDFAPEMDSIFKKILKIASKMVIKKVENLVNYRKLRTFAVAFPGHALVGRRNTNSLTNNI